MSDTPLFDELEEKWLVPDDLGDKEYLVTYSKGGVVDFIAGLQADPAVADEGKYTVGSLVCEACFTQTRKRKLFGRNSQCEGCV